MTSDVSTRPAGSALESLIPGLSKLSAVCVAWLKAGWGVVESGYEVDPTKICLRVGFATWPLWSAGSGSRVRIP